MELGKFRESKLAVPVAVVAAALGFTACGQQNQPPQAGIFTGDGYKLELDGHKTYRIECDETDLIKKLDDDLENDAFSFNYPDHPACEDGQLTESDSNLFSRDPFVNEYTYPASAPDQTPGK